MDFFELLANHHLDSQSRWSKVKDKVETDPRYKAVDSSSQREDLFKQYIEKIAKVGAEGQPCTSRWPQRRAPSAPYPVLWAAGPLPCPEGPCSASAALFQQRSVTHRSQIAFKYAVPRCL